MNSIETLLKKYFINDAVYPDIIPTELRNLLINFRLKIIQKNALLFFLK